MFWRRAALTLVVAAPVFSQQIHLKTRSIDTSVSTPAPLARRSPPHGPQRIHRIVQFDHAPGITDIAGLTRAGAEVLNALPDNALVVSLPGSMAAAESLRRNALPWTSEIEPADKISPALPRNGSIQAIVEFHPDITAAQQDAVLAAAGLSASRPPLLAPNHTIVEGAFAQLALLANDDSVAYIFPADSGITNGANLIACAGMLTTAGPVPQFANVVHGWDPVNGSVMLNYVFGALTPNQPATQVQSEIVRALNAWSQYANVLFEPGTDGSALRTIYIWFASGAHGDGYPFSPTTLGHTFYPVPINPESIAGDMHLNINESWNIGGDIDIYSVALHEAGHALGLGHSDNPGDVMYPYYRQGATLSANDISAIVSLYGPAVPVPANAAPASPPTTVPATTPAAPTPNAAQPATPLTLFINPPPATTQENTGSIFGTVSGGSAPVSVQWQTDRSYTGTAAVANGSWAASGIPLAPGSNNITVTAFDAAHDSASKTVAVTLIPPAPPSNPDTPMSVHIVKPALSVTSTNSGSITLAGEASGGNGGVTKVQWQTLAGASGTAMGVGNWVASNIPLLTGTNTIVVRAFDASGASAWTTLVVVRQ